MADDLLGRNTASTRLIRHGLDEDRQPGRRNVGVARGAVDLRTSFAEVGSRGSIGRFARLVTVLDGGGAGEVASQISFVQRDRIDSTAEFAAPGPCVIALCVRPRRIGDPLVSDCASHLWERLAHLAGPPFECGAFALSSLGIVRRRAERLFPAELRKRAD